VPSLQHGHKAALRYNPLHVIAIRQEDFGWLATVLPDSLKLALNY
jgi:hypothetical protein